MTVRETINKVTKNLPLEIVYESVGFIDTNQKEAFNKLVKIFAKLGGIIPSLIALKNSGVPIILHFEKSQLQQSTLQIQVWQKQINVYFAYNKTKKNISPKNLKDILVYFNNEIKRVSNILKVLNKEIKETQLEEQKEGDTKDEL